MASPIRRTARGVATLRAFLALRWDTTFVTRWRCGRGVDAETTMRETVATVEVGALLRASGFFALFAVVFTLCELGRGVPAATTRCLKRLPYRPGFFFFFRSQARGVWPLLITLKPVRRHVFRRGTKDRFGNAVERVANLMSHHC